MALQRSGNLGRRFSTKDTVRLRLFLDRLSLCYAVIVAAMASLLLASPVLAVLTGDLQGTVFDPHGALVEGARITIRSVATGVAREVTSDSHGEFAALQLEVGEYRVQIEKAGFRTVNAPAEIRSGEQTRLNVNLELGQVSDSVVVEGAVGPELDVSTAQISDSFSAKEVQDLPNLTRDPLAYATLAAGVVPVSRDNPFLGSGSYNSNGQRGRGNNITVDNITSTDISTTGSSEIGTLSLDAVQEIKLITNNYSAEFGRNSGSQYQIITKSGTNEYHGTVYWFHRNAALNARDFFDRTGRPTPFIRNQWGFVAGGPIIKNHLFAFGHYEGIKIRGAGSGSVATVLTPANAAAIVDPTSKALFAAVGAPTDPSGQLSAPAPNVEDQYSWSLRVDETWHGGRDSITARYGTNPATRVSPSLTFVSSNLLNYGANVRFTDRQFAFGFTHTFSPSVINQFRFGFGRSNPGFLPFTTLKPPFAPELQISGFDNGFLGESNIIPQGRVQNTFQYGDSVSYSRGRHNFKFGLDATRYQANSFFDANFRGTFQFGSLSDFQNGIPLAYTQRFGTSVRGNRSTDYFAFAQDDYRITNTLTLNLGVRFESSGGNSEVNNVLANLHTDVSGALGGGGTGPLGTILLGGEAYARNNNWAPRLGFAWNPNAGKLVLRGGYGWAYDYIFGNPVTNLRFTAPFVPSITVQQFTGNNTYAQLAAGTAQAQADAKAAIGQFLPTQKNFGSISPVDPKLQNPRADQWNFGMEYELFRSLLLKTGYVGTKGNRLLVSRQLNFVNPAVIPAPATSNTDEANRLATFRKVFVGETASGTFANNRLDPRFNSVTQVESAATSIYHALEVDVIKRLSHGLQFQAAYTYGHAIDDASDVLNVLVNDSSTVEDPRNLATNRGNAEFDLRHRLTFTHFWELPFFKHGAGFKNKAFGGWAFTGTWSIQSGFKANIFAGSRRGINDILLVGTTNNSRATLSGPLNSFHAVPGGSAGAGLIPAPCARGVNTSTKATTICPDSSGFAFTQPLLGNHGTLGRNVFPLANFQDFDWAMLKNTKITERFTLQFRWEVFNVFNHANFSGFTNTLTSLTFGQYTSTASDTRQMQAGLKVIF
jgi:Carboxypeptidase regulatory-like domain/TonB dependent receptor